MKQVELQQEGTEEQKQKQVKFILDGKEYQDKLVIRTKLKTTFWKRVGFLFKSLIVVEHHLYLQQKAPTEIGTQYGYNFLTKKEYSKLSKKK